MDNTVLEHIIAQYAEEASFLWLLRNRAVHAPHYRLSDLSALDSRIEAHLDGIRTAGDAGWEICKGALAYMEAGEIFTGGIIAFEGNKSERIRVMLETGICSAELSRGIISALGWLSYAHAEGHIKRLLNAGQAEFRRIGIAASVIHRQDPGRTLADALTDSDPLLKMEAIRATGRLGKNEFLFQLKDNYESNHEACRFWSAWSGALLGDANSIIVLKTIAMSDSPYREEAMKTAIRRMDLPSFNEWHGEFTRSPDLLRLAVIGAGTSGDSSFIPWLIEKMEAPELARIAGEAFTMITGVDIANGDFRGEKPEYFETGPTENPENEDIALDPDDDLPWPDYRSVFAWWDKNKDFFKHDIRYMLGQPLSDGWLEQVLRRGRQRERYAAALELVILHPGEIVFEVRAPGFCQEQMLGQRRNF